LQLIKKGLYLLSTKEIMSEENQQACVNYTMSADGRCVFCGFSFEEHLTPVNPNDKPKPSIPKSRVLPPPPPKSRIIKEGDMPPKPLAFESREWPHPPPKTNSVEGGAEELRKEIQETLNEIIDHRYTTTTSEEYIIAVDEIKAIITSQMKKKVDEVRQMKIKGNYTDAKANHFYKEGESNMKQSILTQLIK